LSYTKYKSDYNTRVWIGASYCGQTAGATYSNGFGGKRYGIFANLFRGITKNLQAYAYGDMFKYKLDTGEDDTNPSLAAALGATCSIWKGLAARAEGQLLSNLDYKYDGRFYLKLSYDLHTGFGSGDIAGTGGTGWIGGIR
jgi:hypothetical protein